MSRGSRRGHSLSREELEINQAFGASESEGEDNQNNHNISEPATPPPGQNFKILKTGNVDDLANLLAKTISKALASNESECEEINDQKGSSTQKSNKRSLNEYMDLPLPTGGPSVANDTSPIVFGVDVNPPPPGAEDRNGQGSSSESPSVEILSENLAKVSVSNTVNSSPAVAPDDKLPTANSDIPNWNPDPAVIAWANLVVDNNEWSVEDRKSLMKEYIPDKEHNHLFEPVNMPQQIRDAMSNRSIVESDYLLKRYTAETFLFNCNFDIVTCYRPLLEVISNLKGDPSREKDRFLLGRVFQGLVSSTVKLSRGRRELARRFVPLINAPALFRTKPTHKSIFGKDSTESAVEQAVKDSKQDKALVYIPKKKKLPFRSFGSSVKGFQSFQYPQKYNTFQNDQYQNYSYSNRGGRGNFRGKANRQRGRGGRGKSYQSRAPYSKTS